MQLSDTISYCFRSCPWCLNVYRMLYTRDLNSKAMLYQRHYLFFFLNFSVFLCIRPMPMATFSLFYNIYFMICKTKHCNLHQIISSNPCSILSFSWMELSFIHSQIKRDIYPPDLWIPHPWSSVNWMVMCYFANVILVVKM